jgi:hypothetical protein
MLKSMTWPSGGDIGCSFMRIGDRSSKTIDSNISKENPRKKGLKNLVKKKKQQKSEGGGFL